MKYEDLKESFTFKTQGGKSTLTYTADKKSKHIWTVSTESGDMSGSDWDCEDMLEYFNSGSWVIQDEYRIEETREVQEHAQEVPEVKTLRDEFAMEVLPSIYTVAILEAQKGSGLFFCEDGRYDLALDAYKMADAMMKARKEPL
ncbi:MAG: hypothetical protein LC100_15225 [Chitinophagales bacterium]|nr:hypothetical protein [Chitinophagales bacterium]